MLRLVGKDLTVRLLYLFITLLVVTSCAHNRIRLGKRHDRKIDRSEQTVLAPNKTEAQETYVASLEEFSPDESEEMEASITDATEEEDVSINASPSPTDSATVQPKVDSRDLDEAFEAEYQAKLSRNLFITSYGLWLVPVLGSLASLIVFIIAWAKLSRANSSRFITEEGDRYSHTARVLRNIYLILMGIAVLLMAILLIAFLL